MVIFGNFQIFLINFINYFMIKDRLSILPYKKSEIRDRGRHNWHLCINNEPLYLEGKYLCGRSYKNPVTLTKSKFKALLKAQEAANDEYPFVVNNFNYNGFMGRTLKGNAPYKARFIHWSGDPGVASMQCSDGRARLIPSFALPAALLLPKDETKKNVLFGSPSHS